MKNNAVCILSRACVLRNWQDLPFPGRSDEGAQLCTERVSSALEMNKPRYYELKALSSDKRRLLEARGVFSSEQLSRDRGGCFALPGKRAWVEVYGTDHIRIRSEYPGFQLQQAFDYAFRLEKQLAGSALFAYDERFGYLTASPVNVGSAYHGSVMLHLPLMKRKNKLEDTAAELHRASLCLVALCGKQEDAFGDLYLLSNDTTLGTTEEEQKEAVLQAYGSVMELELALRDEAMAHEADSLEDESRRSLGILRYAYRLDLPDFLTHYSRLRLGSALGLLPLEPEDADELLQKARPGFYPLDLTESSLARAAKIRKLVQKLPEPD